jgi:hypothetical protein
MKCHIPMRDLVMMAMTGATANIEEPALFNLHVSEFLACRGERPLGPWKAEEAGPR